MRAAIFEQFGELLQVETVADPACPPDGVIVEVKACGVCRSDWHGWKGADPDVRVPHVPGHEFAGVVAEVGRDCRRFKVGQRVTAPFILACGACPDCVGGEPTVCNHQDIVGFTAWGAFAERIAVTRADFNLVPVPDAFDLAEVAGMGCRVTTSFRALTDRAKLQPGEWLAVQGCGGIGLSAIMIGAALGASIIAVDINPAALALAKELGATHTLNAKEVSDVGEAVRDLSGGGVQVSLDGLGVTETYLNSLRSLRKLGRHVQIGMPLGRHAEPPLPLLELIYSRQITLMGTRGMAASRFPSLFSMVAAGRLNLKPLITRRIALDDAGAALAEMNSFSGVGITVIDRFV